MVNHPGYPWLWIFKCESYMIYDWKRYVNTKKLFLTWVFSLSNLTSSGVSPDFAKQLGCFLRFCLRNCREMWSFNPSDKFNLFCHKFTFPKQLIRLKRIFWQIDYSIPTEDDFRAKLPSLSARHTRTTTKNVFILNN